MRTLSKRWIRNAIVALAAVCLPLGSAALAQATSRLDIVKEVVPDNTTDFFFTLIGPTPGNAQLDDDATATGGNSATAKTKWFAVIPGVYMIVEQNPGPGWVFAGANCTGTNTYTVDLASRTVKVTVGSSQHIICTITNKKTDGATGRITIVKDATPNDPQDFQFSSSSSIISPFTLDDDSTLLPAPNSKHFVVPVGNFTFTESTVSGWSLVGIGCTGGFSNVNLAGRSVSVQLAAGQNITCTFTNKKKTTGPTAW